MPKRKINLYILMDFCSCKYILGNLINYGNIYMYTLDEI